MRIFIAVSGFSALTGNAVFFCGPLAKVDQAATLAAKGFPARAFIPRHGFFA